MSQQKEHSIIELQQIIAQMFVDFKRNCVHFSINHAKFFTSALDLYLTPIMYLVEVDGPYPKFKFTLNFISFHITIVE